MSLALSVQCFLLNWYFLFVLKCLHCKLNQDRKESLYFHLPSDNWSGERNTCARLQRKGDFSDYDGGGVRKKKIYVVSSFLFFVMNF